MRVDAESTAAGESTPAKGGGDNYLTAKGGIMSWVVTIDHKRIGVMYLAGITGTLLLGGLFAMLLRFELWTPSPAFMTDAQYNHSFTLHGAIMTFLFIIPGIPAVIGNFVLPIMLGAKDMAFPRINLLSWYLWVLGGLFFVLVLFFGGLDTGWTFYTPYSSSGGGAANIRSQGAVVLATTGAFVLGFSSIFTGLNFVATIHKMRPAGMTWFKMPLLLWSLYATAIIQLLATPVLGITLLLLIVERTLSVGIFDPNLGGDPVLYQHFFWFYSHPAVYIMILPAMGVISELFSTFSRKHIFGYRAIALSSLAIAFLGFLVWGHHMFTSTQSATASIIFSALTFSVSIPSAIKVFNWLATMYKGSVSLATPMVYALAFIFLFGIGGLTGLFLGALATDIHLHDTYFVVAHFHFVMVGSTLIAFLGGLHYWWPKMFGRMYNEFVSRMSAILVFIGFNLTFLPQFVMGANGMPRRYHNYDGLAAFYPDLQGLHQLSTVGAVILAVGLFGALFSLLGSFWSKKRVSDNPWGGSTLEWACSSPPPEHNFEEETPAPTPLYEYDELHYDAEVGGFVRKVEAETVTGEKA